MPSEPKASARKPVFLVALGRGGAGKSTSVAELVWRAEAGKRPVIVVDADKRSKTLRELFPHAIQPKSEELEDVKEAITQGLDRMITDGSSIVFDFGTHDQGLVDYGKDLNFVSFCEEVNVEPVALYVLGPDREDLLHAHTIWKSGFFKPQRAMLVMNEGVIRHGKTVAGSFAETLAAPELKEMSAGGIKPFLMRRLSTMDKIRKAGVSLYDAITPGSTTLGPTEKIVTRQWIADYDQKRAAIMDWLP